MSDLQKNLILLYSFLFLILSSINLLILFKNDIIIFLKSKNLLTYVVLILIILFSFVAIFFVFILTYGISEIFTDEFEFLGRQIYTNIPNYIIIYYVFKSCKYLKDKKE